MNRGRIVRETTRPLRPDPSTTRSESSGKLTKKGKVWYVRVRDESGRQREVKAGPDKSVAQSIARDLESKTHRVKAGVLDPREAGCLDAERIPITQHVEKYVQGLDAKGCVEGHVDGVRKRLTWFLEETKITRLSQLRPSLATTALKTLRHAGRSDRTNVALPGRDTKNSDDAIQPLPAHVIPALRSWLATKPSLTPLFPPDRTSALMIR